MLTIRQPNPLDLPPLYNLAEDVQGQYLDDYHSLTLAYAQRILEDEQTVVIDDNGFAVGALWFTDHCDDLHAQMHLLIRPEYWRKVLKQDILADAVDRAFESLGVGKLLAQVMHTQKSAIKLLRRYKFYEFKPWYNHTKQAGVKVDIINFELKRSFWRKQRGNR